MPTIGVFDSGFGGLTVLRELLRQLPRAQYVYLGDTARLPYGAKSQATIARYAVESALFLASRGATHVVIACNTASALAMDEIAKAVSVPVTGVIYPVVERTQRRHSGSETLVLATSATVQSHAYQRLCEARGLLPFEKACPLLVPLIEEGWIDHPVTREVLRIYLREALAACSPAVVVLGCTHYPLIAPLVRETLRAMGCDAEVIDSAEVTAISVAQSIRAEDADTAMDLTAGHPSCEFFVTDSTEKFERLGPHFLGRPIGNAQLVDLGG